MDSIKINDITFLRSAAARDNRVESAGIFKEKSLPMDGLSFDTLDADLYTDTLHESLRAVQAGAPVLVYRGEKQYARFVLEGLKRTGASSYHVTANSPMSALTSMPHPGGIYTGQTVEQVARDICGSVPVMVKSNLAAVKLYGWLPYATARDNLSQVLFAVGAYLGTDLNGVLRVEPLWDGVASTIVPDRMYSGGSVEYGSAVSAVTVSEHQYVQGNEDKELFNGTTQAGDLITFDEPMHSLSATGFTILESGANWAKLSAGSGVLTGKAYIHTTRQITETVTAGAAENIKTVKDATLVSLVNSVAVAKRLADYYRHTEVIKNPVVAGGEKPGHVVSIYHPYDKKMVQACISGADTTMSATLKSDLTALVGYAPPQVETTEYYDERVVLTGSGNFIVPDDVTSIRCVLIGKGADGENGKPGESVIVTAKYVTSLPANIPGGAAGKGGKGGLGGSGGCVYEVTQDVTPGTSIPFNCASGEAIHSVFGTDSSGQGSSLESGYFDPITGEAYARPGQNGVDGGNGGSSGSDGGKVNEYRGGYGRESASKTYTSSGTYGQATISFGAASGGGASATGIGKSATSGSGTAGCVTAEGIFTWSGVKGQAGGDGANGGKGNDGISYGDGGSGGHGGGGAGETGNVNVGMPSNSSKFTSFRADSNGTRSSGGTGGAGGLGADGCIILYFRKPKPKMHSGSLMTRNGRMLLDKHGRRLIV